MCTNCSSTQLVDMGDSISCIKCARVQRDVIVYGDLKPVFNTDASKREGGHSKSLDRLKEVCFRENLYESVAYSAYIHFKTIKAILSLKKYSTEKLLCYSLINSMIKSGCYRPYQRMSYSFHNTRSLYLSNISKILISYGKGDLCIETSKAPVIEYYCGRVGIKRESEINFISEYLNKIEIFLCSPLVTLIVISLCKFLVSLREKTVVEIIKDVCTQCEVNPCLIRKYLKYII